MAMAKADLAAARKAGDEDRAALLEALTTYGDALIVYVPERRHYSVVFGDVERARHVAVMVPGVGDESHLHRDWLPSARSLHDAAEFTAVVLWKCYDNPRDLVDAALKTIECDESLMTAGRALAGFVRGLSVRSDQTLTIVAHSFGSVVTGTSLADCGLCCTDVVVVGSPGMTVEDLRQLHLVESHFFSEEAPSDLVGELGMFGAAPTSPTFRGTRMRTNANGRVAVMGHSSYFTPGSEALDNIVAVVTGRYASVLAERWLPSEVAGSLVAWMIRFPTEPLWIVLRQYRGPGFRALVNTRRIIYLSATQAGNLVRDAVEQAERMIAGTARLAVGRLR